MGKPVWEEAIAAVFAECADGICYDCSYAPVTEAALIAKIEKRLKESPPPRAKVISHGDILTGDNRALLHAHLSDTEKGREYMLIEVEAEDVKPDSLQDVPLVYTGTLGTPTGEQE